MSTIFIAGTSRGIGLGLVAEYLRRGWDVIGTVRSDPPPALEQLKASGRLTLERLDITQQNQLPGLRQRLGGRKLDILFVSAGIMTHRDEPAARLSDEDFAHILLTNALSPMRVVEALASLVSPQGTIVVMTSGLGSVGLNTGGGCEAYRASKAALNTLARSYAARDPKRTVVAMDPGWVKTDMGGPGAMIDVETSVRGIADTLAKVAGQGGSHYLKYNGETVPW